MIKERKKPEELQTLAKALDCIRIALAIETLAYYDKNYLDRTLSCSNAMISETVQGLLRDAEILLTTDQTGGSR